MAPAVLDQIRQTRKEVERACNLLEDASPRALDSCTGVLAGAVSLLGSCRPSGRDPKSLAEALGLGRALRRAGILLRNASLFHVRRFELARLPVEGYNAAGRMERQPGPEIFNVRG
jgi:hypothetical protein